MERETAIVEFNVRGKRSRRGGRAPVRKTASSLTNAKPRRLTRKPLSCPPTLPGTKRSWLERLPIELVEQIFLDSLEISLPRSSPHLGKVLARESSYEILMLCAFFNAEDEVNVHTRNFAPATYRCLSTEHRLKLQRDILDCRWCTLPRLERCSQVVRSMVLDQEWHDVQRSNGDPKRRCRCCSDRALYMRRFRNGEWGSKAKISKADDRLRFIERNINLPLKSGTLGILLNAHFIPNRVLNPRTWLTPTKENGQRPFDLLHFLTYTTRAWEKREWDDERGVSVVHFDPVHVDATSLFEGMKTAIRERRDSTLVRLVKIWNVMSVGCCCPLAEQRSAVTDGDDAKKIPASVWHLATRQGERSVHLLGVITTISYPPARPPKDDVVMTKWILSEIESGSPTREKKAKNLQRLMDEVNPNPRPCRHCRRIHPHYYDQ